MKIKKVQIPLYFSFLKIVSANDFKEVEKKFNLKDTSCCAAFFFKDVDSKVPVYVVVFGDEWDYSIVSHECVHITNQIFKDCNIDLDIDNDEPQAYLHGWIFKQIDIFLKSIK